MKHCDESVYVLNFHLKTQVDFLEIHGVGERQSRLNARYPLLAAVNRPVRRKPVKRQSWFLASLISALHRNTVEYHVHTPLLRLYTIYRLHVALRYQRMLQSAVAVQLGFHSNMAPEFAGNLRVTSHAKPL